MLLGLYINYNTWMMWLSWRHREPLEQPEPPSEPWPFVTVQLPVYNEPSVVVRLLESVGRIDYPSDRFEIQLLDDSTDQTPELATPAIQALRSRGLNVEHIRRQRRDGYKAGALRDGLTVAKGEFVLILDADFVPEPAILKKLLPWFNDPKIALVQARWGKLDRPSSIIERCTAYWTERHFAIEQVARSRSKQFFHFNGSGGIWRKAAIDDSGGWQDDTITEDMELSFRAWFKRWRFIYDHTVVVPAQQPPDMPALKIQQGRWAQGTFQVAKKVLPQLRGLPFWTRSTIGLHLTGYTFPVQVMGAALLSGPITWALLQLPPVAFWLTAIPIATFLAGMLIQVLYRWSQHGIRAGILEIEALIVGLGLAPHIGRHLLQGLRTGHAEFIRTPKTPTTSGLIDRFVWLDFLVVLLMAANAWYAAAMNLWVAVPLPVLAGTGIFFSTLASIFPTLGAAARHKALPQPIE